MGFESPNDRVLGSYKRPVGLLEDVLRLLEIAANVSRSISSISRSSTGTDFMGSSSSSSAVSGERSSGTYSSSGSASCSSAAIACREGDLFLKRGVDERAEVAAGELADFDSLFWWLLEVDEVGAK